MADFIQVTDTNGNVLVVNVDQVASIVPFGTGSQVTAADGTAFAHADDPATFIGNAATQVVAAGGSLNHAIY